MRIAYVGDFINHGKSLQTIGTSIVILLSLLSDVDSIDVFCPEVNEKVEKFELPQKVKLYETYNYDGSISILRLLKIHWDNYDVVIFNVLPTGFGNRTLPNAFALIVPITLSILLRQRNIRVIYHNSIFTNDIRKLGYNSSFDRIRSFFLGIVERTLFKNVITFVLLNLYKGRIDDSIGKNKVHVLKAQYLESITTLYLNKVMNAEHLETGRSYVPKILMHGSWGPQKNIELGLSALKKQKEGGTKFSLVISGGFNHHFPEYEKEFNELLDSYSSIIDEYLGPVAEKDIMNIFLNANLLLLPYNTPGGHSGVLEQAGFFEVPTVAINFPEYEEQAKGLEKVMLVSAKVFSSAITDMLKNHDYKAELEIKLKVNKLMEGIRLLLD